MSSPFDWLNEALDKLSQRSLRRERLKSLPVSGGKIERDGKLLWNFAGNDYLGLADDPRLIESAHQAALEYGTGSRASALVTGRTPLHVELENRVEQFKQCEAALLFPTGFAANVGTICSLISSEDVVFCDRLNHASLVDGCRLSKAKFKVYPHNDVAALERALERSTDYRRKLIVTDALFSMDGDVAPLIELCGLAERHNAMLLVDEAHATGVLGEHGAGLADMVGFHSNHLVTVGTFSKALGAQGGFVAGPQNLIDWIWNTARPNMFSTAMAPPLCGAIMAALDIVRDEPHRREWLKEASSKVQAQLKANGWNIPKNVVGPIIPIIIGDANHTLTLASELQNSELLVAAIRPPTVPKQTSRLRISLSYAHGDAGVNALLSGFQSPLIQGLR